MVRDRKIHTGNQRDTETNQKNATAKAFGKSQDGEEEG